jgi:hypothetical protein
VLDGLAQIEGDRECVGQHCALQDDGPAYLFWLRDSDANVAAVVAVVCNRIRLMPTCCHFRSYTIN